MRSFLRWLQYTLFALAVVLIGAFAIDKASSWNFQRRANATLEAERANPSQAIDRGDVIGRVDVDRLGVSVVVVEGVDEGDLAHAAGHLIGTAIPGQQGNAAIAAHRDTFFRPLRKIRPKDLIRVTTPEGEFHYRVVWTRIVTPDDVAVLRPDGQQELTLITCYPFYYVGEAPERFIVRAKRVAYRPESAGMQPNAGEEHP
ncbi:MAG TPA: class D sortase [Bryobacteraceae bacterium]|nr:class D sortase [Bryobacteraceae bacterium]